jgi:hypothetical protein
MTLLRHLDINHNVSYSHFETSSDDLFSELNDLFSFPQMLTGEISTEIGNLVNLRFLQLDFNRFSGTIPAELGNAKDLGKWTVFNFENAEISDLPNNSILSCV